MTLCGRATLLVFLIGWVSWTYPWDDFLDRSGTPLGADYAMFYVAGQVVLDGDADHLYDQAEHQRRLHELFPGVDPAFCLPFRYPPFVALLMAPLAALPYPASFCAFLAISLIAWGAALAILARHLQSLRGAWRRPVLWAILGWPVAWETLLGGQAALIGLAILCAGVALLRRERFFLAGVVLALAAYKPNLLALVIIGCVVRYPRLLRGLVPTLGLLGLLACVPGGWDVCRGYLAFGSQMAVSSWDVETPAVEAAQPGVVARPHAAHAGSMRLREFGDRDQPGDCVALETFAGQPTRLRLGAGIAGRDQRPLQPLHADLRSVATSGRLPAGKRMPGSHRRPGLIVPLRT